MSRARKEKRRRKLPGLKLHHGEAVLVVNRPSLAVVWWKYLLTLGLYGIWRKRDVSVVTDRRLVSGRGLVSRTERSIPLNRIDSASYTRKGVAAFCVVDAGERGRFRVHRFGPFSAKNARRMADEIDDRL